MLQRFIFVLSVIGLGLLYYLSFRKGIDTNITQLNDAAHFIAAKPLKLTVISIIFAVTFLCFLHFGFKHTNNLFEGLSLIICALAALLLSVKRSFGFYSSDSTVWFWGVVASAVIVACLTAWAINRSDKEMGE